MSYAIGPFSVEERAVAGDTEWVAIRARGAEWSWLTREEAFAIGSSWVQRYGHGAASESVARGCRQRVGAETGAARSIAPELRRPSR
jgi:hypothetical protein